MRSISCVNMAVRALGLVRAHLHRHRQCAQSLCARGASRWFHLPDAAMCLLGKLFGLALRNIPDPPPPGMPGLNCLCFPYLRLAVPCSRRHLGLNALDSVLCRQNKHTASARPTADGFGRGTAKANVWSAFAYYATDVTSSAICSSLRFKKCLRRHTKKNI